MTSKTMSSPIEVANTRDRIKTVAAELYVLRGHDGFSFADIANAIGTTRANIHHHFGNKRQLMDELVEDICANAQSRIERHWVAGEARFKDRLLLQLEDLRAYYDRFNPNPEDRNVWSPLSRLRHDLAVLGDPAARALEKVNRKYDQSLEHAIQAAISAGELDPSIPVAAIVRIFRVTLLSCPPMTQDSGSFNEIEALFAALEKSILGAWSKGSSSCA